MWIGDYGGEGVAPGAPVADLVVRDVDAAVSAGWHPASGLYGFVSLPRASPRRVHVHDPSGSYADRVAWVDMPDRSGYAADIAAARPTTAAPPGVVALTIRPSTAWRSGPADTIIQGDVQLPTGQPAVFAWVEVTGAAGKFSAVTDLVGGYLLRLLGEPLPDPELFPPPSPPTYDISVRLLRASPPADDPYAAWPADIDAYATDAVAFDAAYGPIAFTVPLPVPPSTRTKLLIHL